MFVRSWAGDLQYPAGLAVSEDGQQVLVCDCANERVQIFD